MTAPFLARRIWGTDPFGVSLIGCRACGFQFFDRRLTKPEEARLYEGYRGPQYQRERESCEPWYSEEFNRSLDRPELLEQRRVLVRRLIGEHAGRRFNRILDFGGFRGELVADLIPGASAFVYDVSGAEPIAGVESIQDRPRLRATGLTSSSAATSSNMSATRARH